MQKTDEQNARDFEEAKMLSKLAATELQKASAKQTAAALRSVEHGEAILQKSARMGADSPVQRVELAVHGRP